jgi:hypothetical protein
VLFGNPKVSPLEVGLRERSGGGGECEHGGGAGGDGDGSGGGEGESEGEGGGDGEATAQVCSVKHLCDVMRSQGQLPDYSTELRVSF